MKICKSLFMQLLYCLVRPVYDFAHFLKGFKTENHNIFSLWPGYNNFFFIIPGSIHKLLDIVPEIGNGCDLHVG